MQPNYYELIELPLDPLVESPQLALEALEKKARVWGNSRSAGGNAVRYALYHAELPTMRQQLGQAEGLRRLAREAQAHRLEEVLHTVRLLAGARQEISRDELEALLEANNATVPPHRRLQRSTVERGLGNIRLRFAADLPQKPPPPTDCTRLDAGQLREARQLLTTLQEIGLLGAEDSFYTLLGCEADTSQDVLRQRVDEFDRKQRVDCFTPRNIPHSTPMKNAHTALKRLMRVFFATPQARRGYDRAMLEEKAERRLLPELRTLAAQPAISRELFDHYVAALMALRPSGSPRGMSYSQQEATWLVYEEFCVKHNHPYPQQTAARPQVLAPPVPQPQPVAPAPRPQPQPVATPTKPCPHCGQRYEVSSPSCPHCGKPPRKTKPPRKAAEQPADMRVYNNLEAATRCSAKVNFLGRVRLSWAPARYKGKPVSAKAMAQDGYDFSRFRYVILRKQKGKLEGWDKSCFLATTTETHFVDKHTRSGINHSYMVFVCYNNTALPRGTVFRPVKPRSLLGIPAPLQAFNAAVENLGDWLEEQLDAWSRAVSYLAIPLALWMVWQLYTEFFTKEAPLQTAFAALFAITGGVLLVIFSRLLARLVLRFIRDIFQNSLTLAATLLLVYLFRIYA